LGVALAFEGKGVDDKVAVSREQGLVLSRHRTVFARRGGGMVIG